MDQSAENGEPGQCTLNYEKRCLIIVDTFRRLKASEERLKTQQEELQVTNEELEEKNEMLERQKRVVENARKEIEEKAEALSLASKYKSEFLANMSHELRTPLNSLLLLAQSLTQNREKNLTEGQLEAAQVIYGSGTDLLNLINEILDLAKIEAGRMELQVEEIHVEDLSAGIRASFGHLAKQKGLFLDINLGDDIPEKMRSDRKRIEQVLRNLVSNAIKFTDKGGISIRFALAGENADLSQSGLSRQNALAFSVTDTGIGISPDQQKMIFEAFQQANGGISRKHGGTGLGLSISREIATLLGGEIQVVSNTDEGSTFTLYLPMQVERRSGQKKMARTASRGSEAVFEKDRRLMPAKPEKKAAPKKISSLISIIEDDRGRISDSDKVMLVIEDDEKFAKILYQRSRERGLKCICAPTGEDGLLLAEELLPTGIILDIRLPGMDGWKVLAALKENTKTRHIPVHIVSVEKVSTQALRQGAIGHASKPISLDNLDEVFSRLRSASDPGVKRVLVVEDDAQIRKNIVSLIADENVQIDEAPNGRKALAAISENEYQCIVLDLGLPDISGLQILKKAEKVGIDLPPVIIHTASDLTRGQEMELKEYAESIVLKDVRSKERLLDEVSLFLHRMVSELPDRTRQIIKNLHETDELLKDKTILIVDDDMRTLFALSRLLSDRGMKVLKAENGEVALKVLEDNFDVQLILMDIMMPVMDGYEAIGKIRAQEKYRNLPIIALTAKAMKGDREKCIETGANDYMSKPVDQEKLVSLMRVWLYR